MSLRLRVSLLMNTLLLVFLGALGAVALDILKSAVREEIQASTKVATQTLGAAVQLQGGEIGPLLPYLQSLGRVRANDVVLYGADGQELYRAPPSEYKRNRHAPEWFAGLVDANLTPITIPLSGGSLKITPDSSRANVDAWDDACSLLMLVLAFISGMHWLVHWLVSRTLQPMERIVEGLTEMERANFSARLPQFAVPEFARISETFNRLATTLTSSVCENRRLEHDQHVAALVRQRLEEERRSLARELHDELGQCITAVQTIAVSISNRTLHASPEINGSARTIATVAGRMYDSVHQMISRLREAAPAEPDEVPALPALIEAWASRHPEIKVNLDTRSAGLEVIDQDVNLAVFRIIQESLTNIARHADATHVHIMLHLDARNLLNIMVRDNGRGLTCTSNGTRSGYGVLGMQERVESLCGTFCLESAPGDGVCVRAQLPLVRRT